MRRADPVLGPIVFVVDDDVSVRESLTALISDLGWNPKVFASAHDFLGYARPNVPSCVLLDVGLPDLNGLDVQERLAADQRALPIIFMTGAGDIPTTVRAMKAGASEFLTKPLIDEVLVAVIIQSLDCSRAAIAEHAKAAPIRNAYASLTPREREVMALVTAGKLNKQIAQDLGIGEITVKAHRSGVMRKMSAKSLADLVKMSAIIGECAPER